MRKKDIFKDEYRAADILRDHAGWLTNDAKLQQALKDGCDLFRKLCQLISLRR